ncbi:hypothetical protein CKCE_0231 [Candidatus Kinetoplastibacterium crithidii (ex Angomonas deanei ATCC 30255)]|nr:hypothetical protein CKCE_0231 [Candidatus Kinetoplastibacterium crithidii (ex Angomonas deanei ATCC 30255)]
MRIFNIFNFDDSNWGRGKNKGFSDESKKNSNPPDLDDVWNDLSKRFSNIFGKYGKKIVMISYQILILKILVFSFACLFYLPLLSGYLVVFL